MVTLGLSDMRPIIFTVTTDRRGPKFVRKGMRFTRRTVPGRGEHLGAWWFSQLLCLHA